MLDKRMIKPIHTTSKKKVNIFIGEYYASREPAVIKTLLGSCVAACLYDRINRIGGMNHILLPGKADLKEMDDPSRYSINAMEILINSMMKLGSERGQIIAKVFGGASVIQGISPGKAVGPKISEFVVSFLKNEGIKISGSDLGGFKSRTIFFHTDTGDVFLKRRDSMKSKFNEHAIKEQKEIKEFYDNLKIKNDVTFF